MEATIKVDNLKCGGCANTIHKNLITIKGVESVVVSPETDEVKVKYKDDISLRLIKEELSNLGYPEHGTVEGLQKLTKEVKSYMSCAIGKMTKSGHDKDQ